MTRTTSPRNLTPLILERFLTTHPVPIIATDTETSGLYADDGARVSTASVAVQVLDQDEDWDAFAESWSNVTYGWETIIDGQQAKILSVAWPFDQGREGKPEDNGQNLLWPEADNLGQDEWSSLCDMLRRSRLVMHNGKFDCEKYRVGVRCLDGGVELVGQLVWDTQNVNHYLYPHMTNDQGQPTTSLKPTCERLFGAEFADEGRAVKEYLRKAKLPAGRWDLMPWEVIGKYADIDARITLMLYLRQRADIEALDDPNGAYVAIERRLDTTKVLYRMERRGVPYDEVGSTMAASECRQRAADIGKVLPFEPTPNEAKEFFFSEGTTSRGVEKLDMIPYSVTDKGSPQLTSEIVGRMIEDRIPYAAEWGDYVRVRNAASMWYEGYADAMGTDGRLRTNFRQNGTRSSRFSVERVNLQAIPQDYRLSDHAALEGVITPRGLIANAVPEGWRLYELDLEQAELRVAALFAKCNKMLGMIKDGADLHTYTARELFPDIPESDPLFHDKWRQVGKRGNFSLCFGSGAATFRKMVSKETGIRLTDAQSAQITRDWNALYPEFHRAIDKHMHVVEKRQTKHRRGWLELGNGEKRWFQQFEEAHKAFNQRVQGNLAQFGIDWMIQSDRFLIGEHELHARASNQGVGEVGLVLTIHDSQVLLLPDDEYGQGLADHCAGFANDLWKAWFPGVPGGSDYHQWERSA